MPGVARGISRNRFWSCGKDSPKLLKILGLLTFPMVPYGSLQFLKVPYGSLQFLKVPYALWFLMPYGSLWFLTVPYGSSWFFRVHCG